jgi:DNA-binding NarL/FixJ family response regulator
MALLGETVRMANEQVITVHGDEELVRRAGHLFEGVQSEFVCAARDLDTWSQPQARLAIQTRMGAAGRDDFMVRKLLSPMALTGEAGRLHLRQIIANGVQVRISSAPLPHETIIIDRKVMIVAGKDSPAGREYTVSASPVLVGGVHALFQAAWETATDLEAYLRGDAPHLDSGGRAILRVLGSGLTDDTAARQLGLSVRTYRRRVAELMTKLDADSRFQAGLRAGELGLTG